MSKYYRIELEIFEGSGGNKPKDFDRPPVFSLEGVCAWMYFTGLKPGDRFAYPDDCGKLCPWLLQSALPVINALENGGTLGWTYAGTPYEKVIDQGGVTTEYVRCIDPTRAGIVVKVIRTEVEE